ncbi:hypothetical protein [Streptomyces sp. NPDC058279]
MGDSPHHDVVIIGSGAGGGTLAHRPLRPADGSSALRVGDHLAEWLG